MSEHITPETKVVLFDHDDTLVGTIEPKWQQHKHVARMWYEKELEDDEIRQHWGKPLKMLLGLLYDTDDVDQAMERVLACHQEFPKTLFPDTVPTLSALHETGRKLGVITATSRFSFEHDLDSLGIPRELLDYTQTEEDTPFHKPDARVFEPTKEWLRGIGVADNEVTYIGDGLHDRQAARSAGFDFIAVETGLVTREQFLTAEQISISSLAKLLFSK